MCCCELTIAIVAFFTFSIQARSLRVSDHPTLPVARAPVAWGNDLTILETRAASASGWSDPLPAVAAYGMLIARLALPVAALVVPVAVGALNDADGGHDGRRAPVPWVVLAR